MICSPCLPSQILTPTIFSALFELNDCSMLLRFILRFLSSKYLSIEPQSNVGCLNVGPPNFSPAPVGLLLVPELHLLAATAMACTAAFVVFTTAHALACVMDI